MSVAGVVAAAVALAGGGLAAVSAAAGAGGPISAVAGGTAAVAGDVSPGAAPLAGTRWTPTRARPAAAPAGGHPRLWLTAGDLPRLRGWATAANPLWRDGLAPRVAQATADMDAGKVPGADTGSHYYEDYPTESYAELFAFLSLVHPATAARADFARRARTLLMHVMAAAAKGPAADQPFRDPAFAGGSSDRSRWWGEGFALTVDWISSALTAADKATIRAVFLR